MSRLEALAPILGASAGNGAGDLNREGYLMRKWNWLAVLVVTALSLGTVWAESRACNPPTCCPADCVPSSCTK